MASSAAFANKMVNDFMSAHFAWRHSPTDEAATELYNNERKKIVDEITFAQDCRYNIDSKVESIRKAMERLADTDVEAKLRAENEKLKVNLEKIKRSLKDAKTKAKEDFIKLEALKESIRDLAYDYCDIGDHW